MLTTTCGQFGSDLLHICCSHKHFTAGDFQLEMSSHDKSCKGGDEGECLSRASRGKS